MTADIVRFPGLTRHDIDPDQVLKAAIGQMEGVVLCGYDKDGNTYFASSYSSGGDTLWLLELCKRVLMEQSNDR